MIARVGACEPGESAYLLPGDPRWRDERFWERSWSWHGRLRSVRWRGGERGIVKSWQQFTEHGSPAALEDLLSEAEGRGITTMPSGYGDLFHKLHRSPYIQAHIHKIIPAVPGGWAMALREGRESRPLYQYDIRSAYLWALAQGLPHPDSFLTVKRVQGPGLYLIESPAHAALPYPWHLPGYFPATEEEIVRFDLDTGSVEWGIAYTPESWETAAWVQSIQAWTCHKAVARSFWGRWASAAKTCQLTYDPMGRVRTETESRDFCSNPVWASIITARIRMRLYDVCWRQPVLRVYTDSVVTTEPLEESEQLGGWREVKYFPKGGFISTARVIGDYEQRAA